ncbi:DUF6048 family protein [Siansivirga zeaxanthinifaciens]|uniref:DUF3575 domain-containing protein n=1 Tax=Siansivirga zeaxanthinifaciens CC-SAMT-1 TaxID=1454006 RepID=A0A0C5VXX4_9FLAO|nr:DUF6048 family protein [Siansivirga zeaxanthinifaciens]AJR03966.1 hypothetical protein AW14_10335 [Siansivirga zeaxanthinifaciens CC-SAMT-1]
MKQQHISTYFIKSFLILLVFCVSVHAQNDSIQKTVNDSIKIKEKYGLRVGGDISKLVRSFLDDDYKGFEIVADYRLKKRLYIAGEIGTEEKNTVNDYLNITTKGSYIKGGIDYNLYQNWLDMDNMIYSGFRIGASSFSQNLNSYTIYTTNQYYPPFSSSDLTEFKGLTAIWAEVILGIKAQVLTNLYFGLNVQLKFLASETEPDNFINVYIPGFNKTYDSSGIGVGYGYTISYRIPLYKKDK